MPLDSFLQRSLHAELFNNPQVQAASLQGGLFHF